MPTGLHPSNPGPYDRTHPEQLQDLARQLLLALGEDPDREGLADTPRRWAAWWAEFIDHDPGRLETAFTTSTADELVVLHGYRVWSLCEHHLLPFDCTLTIGYLANGRVLGISKLARLAQKHAHRLQLQERLVGGIADELIGLVGHENVAVVGTGTHLCLAMRGVKGDAQFTCSAMRGSFRVQPELRAELLQVTR